MEKMKVTKKFKVKKKILINNNKKIVGEPNISLKWEVKRGLQIPCKVRWFVAIEMDILHFELGQGDVLELCISFELFSVHCNSLSNSYVFLIVTEEPKFSPLKKKKCYISFFFVIKPVLNL